MFSRLYNKVKDLIVPFHVIASELRILRELYETELESKKIYRLTEQPSKNDTEVFYGEEVEEKTRLQRIFEGLPELDEED